MERGPKSGLRKRPGTECCSRRDLPKSRLGGLPLGDNRRLRDAGDAKHALIALNFFVGA